MPDAASHWTAHEKRQTLAVALAPLLVSLATAVIGGLGVLAGLGLAVPGYLTLFLFVMPGLWLLRRSGRENVWSFAAVCGLGVVLPWLALYAAFFDGLNGKYGGGIRYIATWLLIPGGLAAVCGAVIRHWSGKPLWQRRGL